MSRQLKVTGFTRFLIFMLFIVPIAYLGASYYNGEDGIENIKSLINKGKEKTETVSSEVSEQTGTAAVNEEFTDCLEALERMERTVKRKEQEIEDLEAKIRALKAGQ